MRNKKADKESKKKERDREMESSRIKEVDPGRSQARKETEVRWRENVD